MRWPSFIQHLRVPNMRGFSLIETIVYIALLGLLMAGAILSTYQITQSSYLVGKRDATQEEGNFVLRKIEAAMVGAADVSASGSSLVIDPYPVGGAMIRIGIDGDGDLYLDRDGALADGDKLTTDNVAAAFDFSIHTGPPKGITATTTINGAEFVITHYVR